MNNEVNNNFNNQQPVQQPVQNSYQQLVQQPSQNSANSNTGKKKSKVLPIIIAIIILTATVAIIFMMKKSSSKDVEVNVTYVASSAEDTHEGIVYLDPTDPDKICTEEDAKYNLNGYYKPTDVKSGCMKFYIYEETEDTYKLILDHNTSANVSWNKNGKNSSMGEVATRLKEDTAGWVGNPRLITANEIAHIVGADREDTLKWDQNKELGTIYTDLDKVQEFFLDGGRNSNKSSYSTTNGWGEKVATKSNKSDYAWLYDNTYDCISYGCNVKDDYYYNWGEGLYDMAQIYGYWTSTPVAGTDNKAYYVSYTGKLQINLVYDKVPVIDTDENVYGVRPVIELKKDLVIKHTLDESVQGQKAEYTGKFNGTYIAPTSTDTHKGIAYLDPADPGKKCTEETANKNVNEFGELTGINSGCMKFYIYDDSGDTYKMILNHNTSGDIVWNSEKYGSQVMDEVAYRLHEDTLGWFGEPRLITADEIAHIVGADRDDTVKWDSSKKYDYRATDISTSVSSIRLDGGSNPNKASYSNEDGWGKFIYYKDTLNPYYWLIDNLYRCIDFERGCSVQEEKEYPSPKKDSEITDKVEGYWTSAPANSGYIWVVTEGGLTNESSGERSKYGVRPVIELKKSLINK